MYKRKKKNQPARKCKMHESIFGSVAVKGLSGCVRYHSKDKDQVHHVWILYGYSIFDLLPGMTIAPCHCDKK